MKVLCLALAHPAQRFVPGFPVRGARSLLYVNPEFERLLGLISEYDEFSYVDLRVSSIKFTGEEKLCLVRVDFGEEECARETVTVLQKAGLPFLLFGPAITARGKEWGEVPRVEGDILNIWAQIREDLLSGKLKPYYRATDQPHYFPAHINWNPVEPLTRRHTLNFIRGCACPEPTRLICPEYLYFGPAKLKRDPSEVVGELLEIPAKHIYLLDDDIACEPDYYQEMFNLVWNYRRHWTVKAGNNLFHFPTLIKLLAKAGTKVVFLNDDFWQGKLLSIDGSSALLRELNRRVRILRSKKMLVGAQFLLEISSETQTNYDRIARALLKVDLDLISVRFFSYDDRGNPRLVPISYEPRLQDTDPAWIMNRFYSVNSIMNRLVTRPRYIGFYTTVVHLLPCSFAYRQNFLEGIPVA